MSKTTEESLQREFHVHLVSDATGETLNTIARACLVQFEGLDVQEHFWSLIRSRRQLDTVLKGLLKWPGLVLFTFIDEKLRQDLVDFCRAERIQYVAVLDPVLSALIGYLGSPQERTPGRQHALDANYFSRIEAINFTLAHDDGHRGEFAEDADVVILGVSRTSKTPTCVYLANRGIHAANIPIVPGLSSPVDFTKLKRPLIVGLTKDAESLIEIRRHRLRSLNSSDSDTYTDPENVRGELKAARRLFAHLKCPVIDVTRRSIEETASEIMMLLQRHRINMDKAGRQGRKQEGP